MGWRGTAILLLLAVAAGVFLWFDEPPAVQRPNPATLLGEPVSVNDEESVPLLDVDPSKVRRLRLHTQEETRGAERSGDSWEGTASKTVIDDFLVNLAALALIMEVSNDPGTLGDYGLRPPGNVLELWVDGEDEPVVLEIGERNPSTTGVYARVNRRGPVVLAGALLVWEFEKAFEALPQRAAGAAS